MSKISCFACGACCIAYYISTLNKAEGIKCQNLSDRHLCMIYADRPPVCRDLRADELCIFISTLTLEERVDILRAVYAE